MVGIVIENLDFVFVCCFIKVDCCIFVDYIFELFLIGFSFFVEVCYKVFGFIFCFGNVIE